MTWREKTYGSKTRRRTLLSVALSTFATWPRQTTPRLFSSKLRRDRTRRTKPVSIEQPRVRGRQTTKRWRAVGWWSRPGTKIRTKTDFQKHLHVTWTVRTQTGRTSVAPTPHRTNNCVRPHALRARTDTRASARTDGAGDRRSDGAPHNDDARRRGHDPPRATAPDRTR